MNIPIHKIENYTAAYRLDVRGVPVIKRGDYFVDDSITVNGDAPKKFIGVYDHQMLSNKTSLTAKTGFDILPRLARNGIPLSLSQNCCSIVSASSSVCKWLILASP
jgi:hypothetical protein